MLNYSSKLYILKKKIAFIISRYGIEINGGAEHHCRILAEKLKNIYDVEILTSCAKSAQTWANEYQEGQHIVDGIKVTRFPSTITRDEKLFRKAGRILKRRKPYQKVLRFFGLLNLYEKIIPYVVSDQDNENWVKLQGPYIPGLINHLQQSHAGYDALIFFTYLYYPTIYGIKVAPQKSILIPTAHDEPAIYFSLFKSFFKTPKAILYNTLSEMRFVNRLFSNENIYTDVVGVGIDTQELQHTQNVLNPGNEYVIYIGRIEAGKGCQILIDHFLKYKKNTKNDIKLVMVGEGPMPIPRHPDIIATGFVDEEVKITLLRRARILAMPSFYESLSLVTLESMAYGVPVIANEKCEVLKDHIVGSKAGFLYRDFKTFKLAMDSVFNNNTDLVKLSQNGKKYVAENYSWQAVIEKINKAIEFVAG